jgi:hypothetical protein
MTTPKRKPGRPKTGVDPARGVRVPDPRWDRFDTATKAAGTDRARVLNDFIAWYVHEPEAKRPNRPPAATDTATTERQEEQHEAAE